MTLGLNLSFAAKRWQDPEELAELCAGFGVHYWQFNLDFIDPWWPEEMRNRLANAYRDAFGKKGLSFESLFNGMAAYSYPQFLAHSREVRDAIQTYHERAIDVAMEVGAKHLGIALGGMTHRDAYDPLRRRAIYEETVERLKKLAAYGARKGLQSIQIEPTPLFTEFPNSIESSLELMHDLENVSEIPVQIFLDWGHMLCKPFMGKQADMELWIRELKSYIGDMHLQQTDGLWDRHWDFRHEEDGIVTPEIIKGVLHNSGTEDSVQYLELSFAFEDTDENVYEGVKYSVDKLRDIFEE